MNATTVVLLIALLAPTPTHVTNTDLVSAARAQVGITTSYDSTYRKLFYPGGDVDLKTGVCSDVVVRSFRKLGVDLQRAVHEDMQRKKVNGDSRSDFQPGDIVAWDLGNRVTHIGIVSDKKTLLNRTPLIIHNIGAGVREEDILFSYKIIGHYRYY